MAQEIQPKKLEEALATFLAKICYPVADEIGTELRERISNWRKRNLARVLEKAKEKFEENADSGNRTALPRLVHDVIDAASWTDTEFLQEMWAGLLVSSCTDNGDDESNLIFVRILSQLTSLETKVLNYGCERCVKEVTAAGWIHAQGLYVPLQDLVEHTGVSDFHRLDRELDHLRSLGLIEHGFAATSQTADIAPTPLGLQLYVRCKGSRRSPVEFFNVQQPKPS
jgi:hypothetical protein